MTREQRALKRQFQKAAKAMESKPTVPVYDLRGRQVGWCLRHGEFITNASEMRTLFVWHMHWKNESAEIRRNFITSLRECRKVHYTPLP